MMVTWEIAAAIIGVAATICATVLKIVLAKKQEPNGVKNYEKKQDEQAKLMTEVRQAIAVLEVKVKDIKEDNKEEHDQIRSQIKDLTSLLHDLLTKLAADN